MTVTAAYHAKLAVRETWADNLSQELAETIPADHDMDDEYTRLNGTTTPPVSKCWCQERQLTAGSDQLDLTALPDSPANKDFTDLRVQLVKIKASADNSSSITFGTTDVLANVYPLCGGSKTTVNLQPGAIAMFVWPGNLGVIGASQKLVPVTSSDTDALYEIMLVAG